jgi:hypothetical protein
MNCFATAAPVAANFAKGLVRVIYFRFIGDFPPNIAEEAPFANPQAGPARGPASQISEIM